MSTGTRLAGLLLLTTSLTFPVTLQAQETEEPQTEEQSDPLAQEVESVEQEEEFDDPEISVPGGGIIVTGRRNRDPIRSSTQVLNVLSEEDIARTGEGDIAGALGRVTGLSVVGDGRVFVRGLGDRYSLALLNGLPLPSPEPLSRVVPLDIFPTSVVASSLVQKTYSANYPGEFGGGVINLTTKAVPVEDFLKVSVSASGDTETTFENGLQYFGSEWDKFGFDNGNRDIPSNLQTLFDSGLRVNNADPALQEAIAGQLFPLNLVTLQKNNHLPANYSASLTGGLSFDLGGETYLGIIATAGINNSWRNRSVLTQQASVDFTEVNQQSETFITDNNVLVNGLLGFGLDIGDHTVRWTNLYIRDTLKTARLSEGFDIFPGLTGFDFIDQQTAWFERQLIDTQIVAEFDFGALDVDLRGGYARTDREAPFNANFSYTRTNIPAAGVIGENFVAYFDQTSDAGISTVSFDDLTEELWFGGIDISYELTDTLSATVGYAYSDTDRRSLSREFRPFISPDTSNPDLAALDELAVQALGLRRPGDIINGATLAGFNVSLTEAAPFPVVDAAIEIHAGYGLVRWLPVDTLTIEAGVRYEDAVQTTTPLPIAIQQGVIINETNLMNDYFLPSGTITWEATDSLQLRLSASQTIARPQFRELVEQTYFDPESNRRFRGNPFLEDSELINVEARAEYYLNRMDKISIAGFYKEIDNPIENFLINASGQILTSFANAPSAELYGVEVDVTYGIDLYDLGGSFFETKQLLFLANYTYTQSEISVQDGDIAAVPGSPNQNASNLFDDGAPLVGQSDHIANFSIGIEDTEKTQQLSVLFNYASERVTLRGGNFPDVVEDPGLTVDLVARSDVNAFGTPLELSFEVRNIFGRDNFEFQDNGTNRFDINTFQVGTSFSIGVSAEF